jgi:hypothetical protein
LLVHHRLRPQDPAAPGRGEQGARGRLDRVLPLHDLPRPSGPDIGHRRRGSGADQRDRGVLPPLDPDPLLVPPDGRHLGKVPSEARAEFAAHLRAVCDAATPESGRASAVDLVNRFGDAFPAATSCFTEDLDALLAHPRLPARHRIFCRTTNLIEHSFEEERRRTKVIPRFTDERSAMKLVFAALIRCSARWSRVSITDMERHQLRLLRAELGIDPPPTSGEKKEHPRRRKIA